jgi:hypothetical protein
MTRSTYRRAGADQPDRLDEPVSHQYATRRQLPSQRWSDVIFPDATRSWLRGVGRAAALPTY